MAALLAVSYAYYWQTWKDMFFFMLNCDSCSEQCLWWCSRCIWSSRACGAVRSWEDLVRSWYTIKLWSGNWSRRRCGGFGSFTFCMWETVQFLSKYCQGSAIWAFKSQGGKSLVTWSYPCLRWRLSTALSTHCWGSCSSKVDQKMKKAQFNKINTQERSSVMFVLGMQHFKHSRCWDCGYVSLKGSCRVNIVLGAFWEWFWSYLLHHENCMPCNERGSWWNKWNQPPMLTGKSDAMTSMLGTLSW